MIRGKLGATIVRLSRRLGLLALLPSLALLVAAPAALGAPAWSIHSLPAPTHFTPGDAAGRYQYEVVATNEGGEVTNGSPVVLADSLPAGLTVEEVTLPLRSKTRTDFSSELCEVEAAGGVESVRCEVPSEVPEALEPSLLEPAEQLRMVIRVSVPGALAETTLVNLVSVQGGGAGTASAVSRNEASSTPADAGVTDFGASLLGADGLPNRQAGSTPYQDVTDFAVNTRARFPGLPASDSNSFFFDPAGGDVKDVRVALPPGLIGNPTVVPRCTAAQFGVQRTVQVGSSVTTQNDCPDGSAIGAVIVEQLEGRGTTIVEPLYNLVPPTGMPAQLGFSILGAHFYIDTAVRTGGDYGITAYLENTTQVERVSAAKVIVWGTPASAEHDPVRGHCLLAFAGSFFSGGSCPAGVAAKPFLRMPTSCTAALPTELRFDTWTDPDSWLNAASNADAPTGCAPLDFSPTFTLSPEVSSADTPTGLAVDLHLPQGSNLTGLAEADLKDAVVTLPPGLAVNPSSANGLAACSPAQIELHGPNPAACPDAAKIGTVEVDTPLLDHPIPGAVYVASPHDNPFGSLLAIYIAVADPQTGVVVKLAGKVEADPVTGQLTTSFDENPQLPFEDFKLDFFGGAAAALRTPATCGSYRYAGEFTPWSGTPPVPTSDAFAIGQGANGSPCAASESELPNRPGFSAGTVNPLAGSYSPFVMSLRREDGSQRFEALNVALPAGLTGKLAGIPYCPEADLAAAAARSGREELASPSCPAASQVGTVTVGAGAGPLPYFVQGKAYLTGPYEGAPLSLAIVTPAVAGPYDLGDVVVRAALHVDPRSAQIDAVSDPIPTILEGIPLDVRSVVVSMDRPDFTLNPTGCEATAISGQLLSTTAASAALRDRFQVGGCRGLSFAPRLSLRVFGKTNRNAKPRFRAVLEAAPGEANIARARVNLPHSEFLEQNHIKTICTRAQFAAGDGHGSACPADSIYGRAKAWTPLLDEPLEGPVYLRSSEHELPDLVAALNGQVDVELDGTVDSGPNEGIRNTFELVPDAPVSKFLLEMRGGNKGLLVNSENLCSKRAKTRAIVHLVAHNGAVRDFKPRVRNSCARRG